MKTMKAHRPHRRTALRRWLLLVTPLLIILDATACTFAFSINTLYCSKGILCERGHRGVQTLEQDWSRRQLTLRGGGVGVGGVGDGSENDNVGSKDDDNDDDAQVSNISNTPSTIRSYYLLWSPGQLRTTLLWTFGWLLLDKIGFSMLRNLGQQPIVSRLFLENTFVLPLLASSCCLLQIVLFSLPFFANGCLGFNSILGPLRPYFMSLLLFWVIQQHTYYLHNPTQLVSRLLLAFLPEFLHLWNQRPTATKPQAADITKNEGGLDVGQGRIALQVNVPSMGCVACIAKIDSLLHQSKISHHFQVSNIESSLNQDEKGGKTTITGIVQESSQREDVIQLVLETLQNGGFPSTLDSSK